MGAGYAFRLGKEPRISVGFFGEGEGLGLRV